LFFFMLFFNIILFVVRIAQDSRAAERGAATPTRFARLPRHDPKATHPLGRFKPNGVTAAVAANPPIRE
jgi:hypothetical protein